MFIHQITKVFFLGSLQETPFPRESHVADDGSNGSSSFLLFTFEDLPQTDLFCDVCSVRLGDVRERTAIGGWGEVSLHVNL